MKLLRLIIFLFLAIPQFGIGQEYEVHKKTINIPKTFQDIDFSLGLQDANGFIWLTQSKGGLIRYDNQNFKMYGSKEGIPAGGSSAIFEDSEGMIVLHIKWFDANEQVITVFDPLLERGVSLAEYIGGPLPFDLLNIAQVIQNADGSIWIQTNNLAIYELNEKKISFWGNARGTGRKYDLIKSSEGLAYTIIHADPTPIVITSKNGERQEISLPAGFDFSRFIASTTYQSQKQRVFVELRNRERNRMYLACCNQDGIELLDSIQDVAVDYELFDNKIWFVSNEKGKLYDLDMNLLVEWVQPIIEPKLFFDRQGGWWCGNDRGELYRRWIKPTKFKSYRESREGVSHVWYRSARGILTTSEGIVYVAKGGNMTKTYPNGDCEIINGPFGDYYGVHLEEGTSNLWVSDAEAINLFNIATDQFEKKYPVNNQLLSVLQSYHDRLGQFWLGCSLGIGLWDEEKSDFVKFNGYPGYELPEKLRAFHFYENDKGMWVATGAGLFLFDLDRKTIEQFHKEGDEQHYLPHNVIVHLQEDENGYFWLASKGGGLIHWNPLDGTFEQYTTKNGLRNDFIYACYQDAFDQVWLPSDDGLMRFDKNTKQVIHYTENDGIPDREFNTISHHEDSLGQLYFGGLKGVIRFHPKDFIPKETPYTIALTNYFKTNINDSVYVANRSEALANHSISILPSDKEVSLSFALLNFENSDEWEYAYKLEGLHQKWKTLEKPIVKLTALPYGDYTLHFRCKIEGFHWSEYEQPIRISVIRPYYLTSWFWTLLVISLAWIIWILMRWRLAASRRRERELEKIVKERTHEISQQAEELKSLDAMKTQFFANISHELRTPLTLILGPVKEMKSKRTRDIDSFELNKNLSVIDRNAEKLLGLVEEVLDLSQLDAGKLTLDEESVALLDFVRYVKSNFETNAELNQIEYHLNYTVSARSYFYIDSTRLTTILNNLLSNAFKFCGEEGMITLSVEENQDKLLFSVADKGIGIKTADLPFVFDRFYQAKTENNNAHGGTGIGLALSQELARLMNGEIKLESTFGTGSTFTLEIPKKIAKQVTKTQPITKLDSEESIILKNEFTEEAKPILLLIEDTPDMADYIKSILKTNYSVITANNGKKGLDILEKDHYKIDLIISDVMMPIMDGFTMLSEIKTHEALFNIPIIMLTARASETDKLQALTIGADDYLTKPFSSSELLSRIKNLIANYENRKLWQNDMTQAVKSISKQGDIAPNDESKKTHGPKESLKISKKDLVWLKDVEKLIKKELQNEAFNVQSLAEEMFLSKRQFERKIKGVTGLTPAKLVLEIRLNAGRKFLEDGHYLSVSEVSYAIGIQTPSYFSKVYAKRFGRKPSSYFQ